ncbi:MAG TPA: glycosyl hydrolase family 18 protein, partial [Bacteroidales bacterium]|nr:glycosyl hydrolase family 18 protein [Bacteroidales bacterium]
MFEGTLWELADTVNYNSGWMQNAYYKNKKQILTDIQTLRARGIKVLMNVDDAASWSTATPFTTYNGTALNYTQFASFVYNCVTTVGFDGISLDVEHGATDNTNYRNLIKELGKYFGPLSSNSSSMIYTGAFYSGGAPGPIFRETSLSQYLNFVMDMAYFSDNTTRFNYWAATLGNSKVMDGMSYDENTQASAVAHAQWHPTPDKAGIMVFAANKNKTYTDAIFAALTGGCAPTALTPYVMVNGGSWQQTNTTSLAAGGTVVLGPGPNTGTWSWTGPNSFTASTREITLSNIQTSQAGNYVAANTNSCGAQSSVTFTITVNASGSGTDITNLGGTISAQYTDSPSGEDITKLIDNNSATKYLTSHSSGWVRYYRSTGSVVVKYTITSANDVPSR